MRQQKIVTLAAIDIGSNTIEVLIAHCVPDNLEIIEHQSTLARLGENVDSKGEISRDKFKAALDVVGKYQKLAKKHGAEEILVIATKALREARNNQDFIEAVKRETGLEVQLITWLTSVPIGSGVIHDRYLPSDPPTHEEMEAARSYLASYVQMIRVSEQLSALIFTGSSASSLLKLAQHSFKLDEQSDQLTLEDLARCKGLLGALKAEEIAKRFEQRVERARILAAGALIIQTMMQHLHINEIRVSSHGVREGALLAYTRFGEHWLEEVDSIAAKWCTSLPDQDSQAMQEVQQRPFAEFGSEVLPEYATTFLKWPDDVRKQEDIEAVHKMRVASRRLRAAVDAFEPCIDPSSFKKINRHVKKLADRLGTVRDTDVMVAGLRGYLQEMVSEEQAGVQWLMDRLDIYHNQEEQALDTELQALDEDALQQEIESCIPKGAAHHGKS